jgi:hypothetical protein
MRKSVAEVREISVDEEVNGVERVKQDTLFVSMFVVVLCLNVCLNVCLFIVFCIIDETVVQLLLNQGANVNAQGGQYGTALQAASMEGHEAVVQLFLNQGANVNAQGGHYGTALLVVARFSSEIGSNLNRTRIRRSGSVNA